VYSTLFAIGQLLFGYWLAATLLGALALVGAVVLARRL
jgi:hypothetical protein